MYHSVLVFSTFLLLVTTYKFYLVWLNIHWTHGGMYNFTSASNSKALDPSNPVHWQECVHLSTWVAPLCWSLDCTQGFEAFFCNVNCTEYNYYSCCHTILAHPFGSLINEVEEVLQVHHSHLFNSSMIQVNCVNPQSKSQLTKSQRQDPYKVLNCTIFETWMFELRQPNWSFSSWIELCYGW